MRRKIQIIHILFLFLTACDCQYHLSGVVLDKLTRTPIEDVAIGRTDTADLDNSFNKKTMTGGNGQYEIYGIAGKCNEITMFFTKEGYGTQEITFKSNSTDTIFLQPTAKQRTSRFNINEAFDVFEVEKSNDYSSTEAGVLPCAEWTLNESQINQIIKESQPISGPEWHYMFGHYPCRIHGKILQDSVEFEYSINSGAWFTISSSDTTLLFGSFKEENNKYFLDTVWSEEEME